MVYCCHLAMYINSCTEMSERAEFNDQFTHSKDLLVYMALVLVLLLTTINKNTHKLTLKLYNWPCPAKKNNQKPHAKIKHKHKPTGRVDSHECACDSAKVWYTTQTGTAMIILPLIPQTIITAMIYVLQQEKPNNDDAANIHAHSTSTMLPLKCWTTRHLDWTTSENINIYQNLTVCNIVQQI